MDFGAIAFKFQTDCTEYEWKFTVKLGEKNEVCTLFTYPINQLSHHAIPHLTVRVFGAIFTIRDKLQLVLVAHVLGDLCRQLNDVAFILVIPLELAVALLQHHVRRLLPDGGQACDYTTSQIALNRHVLIGKVRNNFLCDSSQLIGARDRLILLF